MVICKPEIREHNRTIRVEAMLRDGQTMWFEIDNRYAPVVAANKTLMNAFMVAMLPNAMSTGQDIVVEAPVSARLVYQMNNNLVPVLRLFCPKWAKIKVVAAAGYSDNKAAPRHDLCGAATGFSGGVDSFYTICSHRDTIPGFSLKHLALVNAYDPHVATTFERYRKVLRKGASDVGLDLIEIDTNFAQIRCVSYLSTHTLSTISAIFLLDGLIDRYLYSSGFDYPNAVNAMWRGTEDISAFDAMILPLLSTETQEFVSFGSQYTRMEKLEALLDYVPSHANLNVCTSPDVINCGRCGKCTRTLFALYALRALDKYRAVFDIDAWRNEKHTHLAAALMHGSPLTEEIIRYADAHNVWMPSGIERVTLRAIGSLLKAKAVRRKLRPLVAKLYRGPLRK